MQWIDAHLIARPAVVAQDRAELVLKVQLARTRLSLAAEWAVKDLCDLGLGLLGRRLGTLALTPVCAQRTTETA